MAAQKVGRTGSRAAVLSLRFGIQVSHREALDLFEFDSWDVRITQGDRPRARVSDPTPPKQRRLAEATACLPCENEVRDDDVLLSYTGDEADTRVFCSPF